MDSYVSDYRINLFEIAWLEEEQIRLFTSDFKIVADYFVQMRKHGEYVPSDETLKHVDAVLKLMAVLTGDDRFEEILYEPGKGTVKKMSDFLDRVEARGETIGILKSIRSLMKTLKCSAEQAMDMLEVPAADREKYRNKMKAG